MARHDGGDVAKAADAGGMARHVSCEVTEAAEAGGMAVAWW